MTRTECPGGCSICLSINPKMVLIMFAVQRIESGQRFVTDIELVVLAKVLNVSIETLLTND